LQEALYEVSIENDGDIVIEITLLFYFFVQFITLFLVLIDEPHSESTR
jgi:hypothetical protein